MSTLQEICDLFGEDDVLYLDPLITKFSQPAAPPKRSGVRYSFLKRRPPETASTVRSMLGQVAATCENELGLGPGVHTANDIQEKLIAVGWKSRLKIANKLLELRKAVYPEQRKGSVAELQEARDQMRRLAEKTSIEDTLLIVDGVLNKVDLLPGDSQEMVRIRPKEGAGIGYAISDWSFHVSELYDPIFGLRTHLVALDRAARESRIVNVGWYPFVTVFGTYETRLDSSHCVDTYAILFKQAPPLAEVCMSPSGGQRNRLEALTAAINRECDMLKNRPGRIPVDAYGYYGKDAEFLKPLLMIELCYTLKNLDWLTAVEPDALIAYQTALRTLSGCLGRTRSKISVYVQRYL
jgi:hypothetical protein